MNSLENNNSANFDFERAILYTRKRSDELNYHQNDSTNVKKPLPIQFKTPQKGNLGIDPKFTINPITGSNSAQNITEYSYPINSYQNKKECRTEMESRISGYQNLPQTQAVPISNKSSSNSQSFSHIPTNTRLSNSNEIYSHLN